MVMIGPNGVGKTSTLDAISLLSASAGGNLNKTLNDMGGLPDVLTRGSAGALTFAAEMQANKLLPLKYQLEIEPKAQSYSISREFLSQEQGEPQPFKYIDSFYDKVRYSNPSTKNLEKPDWEHNPLETSLSQVPKMYQRPEELRRVLTSVTQYHVLDVGKRAPVKLPQQMRPAELPGENGEDLVSFLYNLRETDRDGYEIIEDTLSAAFPGFEGLSFPPAAAGMLSMTWKDKNFKTPIYVHQLSEGTLRFLWLVSLLQSPAHSTITMIDEPEVSLHPELLCLFADLLREASTKTQVIIATHSERLIRFLEPREVLIMNIDENGYSVPMWADTLDLERWLNEYELDELWRMKRLGEGA